MDQDLLYNAPYACGPRFFVTTTMSDAKKQPSGNEIKKVICDTPNNPFLDGGKARPNGQGEEEPGDEARLPQAESSMTSLQGEEMDMEYVLYISPLPPPFATDELKSTLSTAVANDA
jgi:hypothetical protein